MSENKRRAEKDDRKVILICSSSSGSSSWSERQECFAPSSSAFPLYGDDRGDLIPDLLVVWVALCRYVLNGTGAKVNELALFKGLLSSYQIIWPLAMRLKNLKGRWEFSW